MTAQYLLVAELFAPEFLARREKLEAEIETLAKELEVPESAIVRSIASIMREAEVGAPEPLTAEDALATFALRAVVRGTKEAT